MSREYRIKWIYAKYLHRSVTSWADRQVYVALVRVESFFWFCPSNQPNHRFETNSRYLMVLAENRTHKKTANYKIRYRPTVYGERLMCVCTRLECTQTPLTLGVCIFYFKVFGEACNLHSHLGPAFDWFPLNMNTTTRVRALVGAIFEMAKRQSQLSSWWSWKQCVIVFNGLSIKLVFSLILLCMSVTKIILLELC